MQVLCVPDIRRFFPFSFLFFVRERKALHRMLSEYERENIEDTHRESSIIVRFLVVIRAWTKINGKRKDRCSVSSSMRIDVLVLLQKREKRKSALFVSTEQYRFKRTNIHRHSWFNDEDY